MWATRKKLRFVATTKQEHQNPLNLTTNQVLQLFNVRKHTLGTVLVFFFFSLLFQQKDSVFFWAFNYLVCNLVEIFANDREKRKICNCRRHIIRIYILKMYCMSSLMFLLYFIFLAQFIIICCVLLTKIQLNTNSMCCWNAQNVIDYFALCFFGGLGDKRTIARVNRKRKSFDLLLSCLKLLYIYTHRSINTNSIHARLMNIFGHPKIHLGKKGLYTNRTLSRYGSVRFYWIVSLFVFNNGSQYRMCAKFSRMVVDC